MTFPTAPSVPLPEWATDVGSLKVDPGTTKRALGWTYAMIGVDYGEKPPFQWVNNELYNNGVWANYFSESLDYIKAGNFDHGLNSTSIVDNNSFYGTVRIFNMATTSEFILYPAASATDAMTFYLNTISFSQTYRLPDALPANASGQVLIATYQSGITSFLNWGYLSASDIMSSNSAGAAGGFLFADFSQVASGSGEAESNTIFRNPLAIGLTNGKYLVGGSIQINGLGAAGPAANNDLIFSVSNSVSPGGGAPSPSWVFGKDYLRNTLYFGPDVTDAYNCITINPYIFRVTGASDIIYLSFLNSSAKYGFYDWSASLYIIQI